MIFPTSFIEKTILSLVHILSTLVENQLAVDALLNGRLSVLSHCSMYLTCLYHAVLIPISLFYFEVK
jgi:hypothetical protein